MNKLILLAATFVTVSSLSFAQDMGQVEIAHISRDFGVERLHDPAWQRARPVKVTTYWSGETAPAGRHFEARLLWSKEYLYVLFRAPHSEPPVVNDKPNLSKKTIGLWDRDVCEIFIAPDKSTPKKYFEFEIAPTGEWVDLGIEVTPTERLTDREYNSKMQSAAEEAKGETLAAVKIPFKSLGSKPVPGDVWRGNIFRCIGRDPDRGYLSWRPTKTEKPNFHVPSAFGQFLFVK